MLKKKIEDADIVLAISESVKIVQPVSDEKYPVETYPVVTYPVEIFAVDRLLFTITLVLPIRDEK